MTKAERAGLRQDWITWHLRIAKAMPLCTVYYDPNDYPSEGFLKQYAIDNWFKDHWLITGD